MDTILVKPRNQEELDLVQSLLKRMDIRAQVVSGEKIRKRKAKSDFLESLPERIKMVEQHLKGEIKLPDARSLLNEL